MLLAGHIWGAAGKVGMQAEVTVEKVEICANDKFVDAHIVPIEIEDIKDSKLYTCGSALLPPDSAYANYIIVREAIVCSSYLEPQYYSSMLVHFPPACYYCGLGEDSLVNDDKLKELK